ncbi:MAG: dihydroorotate dehydrogenase [Dehalococcoidia bacterium]|nr:dihydroorotate dehydrogenase [Dehalococcoidia bacterium]
MLSLSVQLAPGNERGLLLKNPVMTASGTFGYGMEYAELFDIQRLGAMVCKGITVEPRDGNPQPRLMEVGNGVLNSIGLENIGIEALLRDKLPVWAQWELPAVVNISGESVEQYAQLARRLEGKDGVSALEVNISCPNVDRGGIEFGTDATLAAEVTAAVLRETSLPVIIKLSPNVTDVVGIARSVADAGADAICLTNTLRGMAIDVTHRRPVLGNIWGGLSGPVIKPVALSMVYQVASAVKIPLIGCGGITNAEDAMEFIMAGATAVQVGTSTLASPGASLDVLEGIERFIEDEGIGDINELVGVAHRQSNLSGSQ